MLTVSFSHFWITACEEFQWAPRRLASHGDGVAFTGSKDSFVCVLPLLLCPPLPCMFLAQGTSTRSPLGFFMCRSIFEEYNVAVVTHGLALDNVSTHFGCQSNFLILHGQDPPLPPPPPPPPPPYLKNTDFFLILKLQTTPNELLYFHWFLTCILVILLNISTQLVELETDLLRVTQKCATLHADNGETESKVYCQVFRPSMEQLQTVQGQTAEENFECHHQFQRHCGVVTPISTLPPPPPLSLSLSLSLHRAHL